MFKNVLPISLHTTVNQIFALRPLQTRLTHDTDGGGLSWLHCIWSLAQD